MLSTSRGGADYGKNAKTEIDQPGGPAALRGIQYADPRPAPGTGKGAGQGKGAAPRLPEPGTGGAVTKKRRRPIHLHVMVSEEEQALIRERMAEAGIRNMGAYMRKMALNGYVLHVDLSPVQELVSLQRRCSNNLNQVAIQANTYGGIYPEEITALQRDYEKLWRPLSDLLEKLSAIVRL